MPYDLKKDVDYRIYEQTIKEYYSRNLPLAERTFNIYRDLNTANKKDVFDILILRSVLEAANFAPRQEEFRSVLKTMEMLKKVDQLEQVMEVVGYFVAQQKIFYEDEIAKAKKEQPRKATEAKRQEMIDNCLALEDYLQKVEFEWHLPHNDADTQPLRNAQRNREQALKIIFKNNEDKIIEAMKSRGIETAFEKEFANCFKFYTKLYIKYNKKTVSGYIPEKRASRSEESKNKSSKAARKSWQKRRKQK